LFVTRRRLLTAATATALLAVLTIGAPTSASSAATKDTAGSVVVIGTVGLSWSDVSAQKTPALWSLLRDGATATLSIQSVHANTCPVDGWLTLSAGEQASDANEANEARPPCRALPEQTTAGRVPHWDEYVTAAAATRFDAPLGLLGDQIAGQGRCLQAVGPGAALGAARSNGNVALYQAYEDSTLATALARCPATLVDVGSVRDPADVNPRDEVRPTTTRAQQVAAVDARVGAVLKATPPGTDVILASLADAGVTERLRLIAAHGPSFGTGTLESSSTRQPGLVQITDLAPTILQRLDIPPPTILGGAALRFANEDGSSGQNTDQSAEQRRRALLDYDEASHKVRDLVAPFFTGWVLLQAALYAIAATLWRRGWGTGEKRWQLLGATHGVAVIAATVPVSTFLANLLPWWRFSEPMVSVAAAVALFAAAISMLALLGPWRRRLLGPITVVCVATIVVLALDVMTGSRLQLSSLMGLQPIIGGRFYGMGNVTFALFATATLVLCTAVGDHLVTIGRRQVAAGTVATIGLAAVIIDGSPSWGSDLGGPTALLPAVILLVLTILGVRLTWRRLLAIGGGVGVLLGLVGLLDWLRPAASRSHLGRFVQTAMDGDAWDIIVRKLEQNITLMFDNPLSLLVPVGLVLLGYLLARPTLLAAGPLRRAFRRVKLLRGGLVALLVMWVLGFALNDSGAAIPTVGGTLAIPLLIAIALRSLEEEQADGSTGAMAPLASRPRQ
jgi:hypothetical protein